MGPVIVWTIIIFIAISAFLESYFPGVYRSWQTYWAANGGIVGAVVSVLALILVGFLLFITGWVVWYVWCVFIMWPYMTIKRLFRPRPAPPLEILPWSQRPFNERFEYASKEVHEILSKMKEYADGFRTVTDEMWSAMREWALDIYMTYLRNDGQLGDAWNYTYIILQRHIEGLPENLPLGSYLQVPLSDLMEKKEKTGPYAIPGDKLYDVLVPYRFSEDVRYLGTWIPARPNAGKTNLLHCMIEDAMPAVAKGEASVVIIDSKSNDKNGLLEVWPCLDYEHEWGIKNVYYFQASDNLAINVFDLGDIDQIVPLFEYMLSDLIGHQLSGPQRSLLTNCLHVIKASDAPSIPALRDLIANGTTRHLAAIYRTREHIREYFTKSMTETFGRRTQNITLFDSSHYRETRLAVLERLHSLLSFSDKLYPTLVATKTQIDLGKLIDEGSVIVINAKLSDLGSKGSELWQRWWTMMLLEAGRKRRKYHPCYVFMDEAHRGIARDTKIPEILEELRSAHVAVTISHQGDWQIQDPSVLRALHGLSAVKLTATGERGIFKAQVYEKSLTIHVAEAGVRYRKRITSQKERNLEAAMHVFSNPTVPPLVPLLTFVGPELNYKEPEIVYPEAAEPEPEPFKYTGKPIVTDVEYTIVENKADSVPDDDDPLVRDILERYQLLPEPPHPKSLPPTSPVK